MGTWGRIFSFAKGPLGIITIIAVGAAIVLQTTSVQVTVKNIGCEAIDLSYVPVALPGLSLPQTPIASGSSGVVTLPPLSITVDGTVPDRFGITAVGFSTSFEAGGVDITVNGTSLRGKKTTINLGERKNHSVIVTCS